MYPIYYVSAVQPSDSEEAEASNAHCLSKARRFACSFLLITAEVYEGRPGLQEVQSSNNGAIGSITSNIPKVYGVYSAIRRSFQEDRTTILQSIVLPLPLTMGAHRRTGASYFVEIDLKASMTRDDLSHVVCEAHVHESPSYLFGQLGFPCRTRREVNQIIPSSFHGAAELHFPNKVLSPWRNKFVSTDDLSPT